MREFKLLTSIELANDFIKHYQLSFIYITSTDCGVCHALKPQIQKLMMSYPAIQLATINAQEVQEVAGRFSVFTVPVLLLFVDGREYVREARIVHMDLLDEKISRIYDLVMNET